MYRKHQTNPAYCAKVWTCAGFVSLFGSLAELGAVIAYMVTNWKYWNLELKVVMPIIHPFFMAAQLHVSL